MPTYIALLRGINVGGRNRVAMADLRQVLTSLGHADVTTYIQSGNAVFTTGEDDAGELAAAMERAIQEALGVQPRVVVLSRDDLAGAVRDNPYPGEANPKAVHAIFLSGHPGPDLLEAVSQAAGTAARQGSRDTAQVVGRTIYLHTPDGYGRSDLAASLNALTGRPRPGSLAGTARNWATVTTLLTMCDS